MTLPLSPEIGPDLDKFLELGAYMFFSLRSDRAADLPRELPSKEDIHADLQALISFHTKVSGRKAVLEKGHNYEKGPAPEFL